MLRPENELDLFVRKLKQTAAFENIRFIHAKKAEEPEKPVDSFFVACGVGAVHKEKDTKGYRKFTAELEFHIYAPYTKGARELTKLAVSLMENLDCYDFENKIADIKISEPVYDRNLCTLCQKVTAVLLSQIVPSSSETFVTIEVNGVSLQAVSVGVQVQEDLYVLRELLTGDTDRQICKGVKYILSIAVESANDPFEVAEKPDVSLCLSGRLCSFRDCRIIRISEQRGAGGVPVRKYEFHTRLSDFREENGENNE